MIKKFKGTLEVDTERGVIYFHLESKRVINIVGAVTYMRICRLPTPIPTSHPIDITHMFGADWHDMELFDMEV